MGIINCYYIFFYNKFKLNLGFISFIKKLKKKMGIGDWDYKFKLILLIF